MYSLFDSEQLLLQNNSENKMSRKKKDETVEVEKLLKQKKEEAQALRKMLENLNSKDNHKIEKK